MIIIKRHLTLNLILILIPGEFRAIKKKNLAMNFGNMKDMICILSASST